MSLQTLPGKPHAGELAKLLRRLVRTLAVVIGKAGHETIDEALAESGGWAFCELA
jgi:hypothetical protein